MSDRDCGDCRKPIVDSCKCTEHLRICEEQQRAERAESDLEAAADTLIRVYGLVGEWEKEEGETYQATKRNVLAILKGED